MNKDLLQDYFTKSGFDTMQAEALAAIMAEFRAEAATKQDLAVLRSELRAEMAELRGDLRTEMAQLKEDLTWRIFAAVIFLATVMTLVDVFVD